MEQTKTLDMLTVDNEVMDMVGLDELLDAMTASAAEVFLKHGERIIPDKTRLAVYDHYVHSIEVVSAVSTDQAEATARQALGAYLAQFPSDQIVVGSKTYVDTEDLSEVVRSVAMTR